MLVIVSVEIWRRMNCVVSILNTIGKYVTVHLRMHIIRRLDEVLWAEVCRFFNLIEGLFTGFDCQGVIREWLE